MVLMARDKERNKSMKCERTIRRCLVYVNFFTFLLDDKLSFTGLSQNMSNFPEV